MNDIDFQKKLLETFKVEAAEHLQAIVNGLLTLEKLQENKQSLDVIETIHREMHSFKGAARAVNLLDHEMVCQSLEKIFLSWKESYQKCSAEDFDRLHEIFKKLQESVLSVQINQLKIEKDMLKTILNHLKRFKNHESDPEPNTKKSILKLAPIEPLKPNQLAMAQTVRIDSRKLDSILIKAEEMLAIKLVNQRHLGELEHLSEEVKKLKKMQESFLSELNMFKVCDDETLTAYRENMLDLLSKNKLIESSLNHAHMSFDKDHRQLTTHIDNLLDDTKKIMMLPFTVLLDSFPAMVRSLARNGGKEVDFDIQGGEIEIDKRILEELKDPLMHLVRNAIDHGIENDREDREKLNKPKRGALNISISQLGTNEVEIIVSDDGKGVDVEKVKSAAIHKGLLSEKQAKTMDDAAALSLIYQSGISTSAIMTEISGQGLGMTIVYEKISKLGGHIDIESHPHQGTQFKIKIPLTLATYKGILINLFDKIFVVPTSHLECILRIQKEDIKSIEGKRVISLNEQSVPLIRMNDILNLSSVALAPKNNNYISVLVIAHEGEGGRVAFEVDEILNEQEVLVKKFNKPLIKVKYISALTILGDGSAVPILNPSDLIKAAMLNVSHSMINNIEEGERDMEIKMATNSILVTDDSITTRSLLKNILELAGFNVKTAVDGLDAWRLLKEDKFDLIVSDVEMPRMDGFTLTEKIRKDKTLSGMPVVLVTGKESREDKERGIDVGANAYIIKSNFDDTNLLSIIKRLIS